MTKQYLDPVCNMTVTPETAAGQSEYQDKTYYFCSRGCKVAFDKNPETYLENPQDSSHGHSHH